MQTFERRTSVQRAEESFGERGLKPSSTDGGKRCSLGRSPAAPHRETPVPGQGGGLVSHRRRRCRRGGESRHWNPNSRRRRDGAKGGRKKDGVVGVLGRRGAAFPGAGTPATSVSPYTPLFVVSGEVSDCSCRAEAVPEAERREPS